jgi:predicted anti-sigma-YlaC factor YlaD
MIDCDRAAVLIERHLDGEASPQDDAALDAHVAGCPSCADMLGAETTIDAALAARFRGAMPSHGFAAAVRARVAAERPAPAEWIPDALNAAGLVVSFRVVLPLAAWWGGAMGAAISVGAVLVGSYPLLLAAWASEAGPGQPDPTA